MRLILITFTSFWTLTCLAAEPAGQEANMGCVEKLQVPLYPPLAAQVHLYGVVVATIVADELGAAEYIIVYRGMLTASENNCRLLSTVLRLSKYSIGCGNKPITLVFNFVLGEQRVPNGSPNVFFGHPNRFWISAPPNVVNPETIRK